MSFKNKLEGKKNLWVTLDVIGLQQYDDPLFDLELLLPFELNHKSTDPCKETGQSLY